MDDDTGAFFFTAALCIAAHIYTFMQYSRLSACTVHKTLFKSVSVPQTDTYSEILVFFCMSSP